MTPSRRSFHALCALLALPRAVTLYSARYARAARSSAPALSTRAEATPGGGGGAENKTTSGDGAGEEPASACQWVDYRPLPPCAQLAAGGHHSLFLTARGFVLSSGKNSNGQLGHSHVSAAEPPSVIAS